MKTFLRFGILLAFLLPALAHGQWAALTASNIQDVSGAQLASGQICVQAVDNANHPIGARVGTGSGQAVGVGCASIVNGAIAANVNAVSGTHTGCASGSFCVPDTSQTAPLNVCLRVTIKNADGVNIAPPGYTCLQPSSSQSWCSLSGSNLTCNLDQYQPNVASQALIQTGPTGPQGPPGDGNIAGLASDGASGINVTGAVSASVIDHRVSASRYASLNAAAAACPLAGGCVIGITDVTALTAALTVPATTTLEFKQPGRIDNAGFALTISGPIDAAPYQIFSGSGAVTGLSTVAPEWFGSKTISPSVVGSVAAAGGAIQLQNATYASGFTALPSNCITQSNLSIIGARRPVYSSDYTKLQNGTIITGGLKICANNVTVEHLGIDVGSAYVANGGTVNDGLDMDGPNIGTENTSDPILHGAYVYDVAALEISATALYHAFRVEHYDGVTIRNIEAVFGVHGLALKSSDANLDGFYSRGNEVDCLAIKGDLYTQLQNVKAAHIRCTSLNSSDTGVGVVVEAAESTGTVSNVQVSDVQTSGVLTGIKLFNSSAVGDSAVNRVQFNNIIVDEEPNTVSVPTCFMADDDGTHTKYIRWFQISNMDCINASGQAAAPAEIYVPLFNGTISNWLSYNSGFSSTISGDFSIHGWTDAGGTAPTQPTFTTGNANTILDVYGYVSTRNNQPFSVAGGGSVALAPNAEAMQMDAAGSNIFILKPLQGSGGLGVPVNNGFTATAGNSVQVRGGPSASDGFDIQDNAITKNILRFAYSAGMEWNITGASSSWIPSSDVLPQVGTPTGGHAACVKSSGPPVVIGYCSDQPTASGTCTCN